MKTLKGMLEVKDNLKENFNSKLSDPTFRQIIEKLKVDREVLYKNTSGIEDCKNELLNCANCKGLEFCKNMVTGYRKTPKTDEGSIVFTYEACKYENKYLRDNSYKNKLNLFDVPKALKDAKMKNIYTDDKSRIPVIKYLDSFYNDYGEKEVKGLYLHGNFGTGKTYLISALFNELAKKGIESCVICFPEFLRTLKASFGSTEGTYSDRYNIVKKSKLLLIDDIGAENVTIWGRDEILGPILQYRMDEKLPTFLTSNLTINELEDHLAITNKSVDRVKSRRIIERIKFLTKDIEVIGPNRRK